MEGLVWTLELRLALALLLLGLLGAFGLGRWTVRRSLDRWRPSMARAPLGFLRLLPGGRYADANLPARRILGLDRPAGPLPSAPWRPLLEEDQQAVQREGVGRARALSLPDGQALRWWLVPEGETLLLFVADAATDPSAWPAMRRLLGGMAHELRTPLATFFVHLEILKQPHLDPERHAQSLRLMEEEARRMSRLVHTVLELGRLSMGEPLVFRPVDLAAVAEAAAAQKQPEALARGQTLTLEIAEGLPRVRGDADALKQVFLNLLDNAIRYSRPGDRIRVALRRSPEGVEAVVADTGPGIPAAHRPHLTEPFYRGEAADAEGIGLGLTVVAEILRHHGARLEIDSRTEGETGTVVRFVLPAEEGMP